MKDIKQWCNVICIVAILSGVFITLIPENKLKQLYKFIVSGLIIYAVIIPFNSGADFDFKIEDYILQNEELKIQYKEKSYNVIMQSLEEALETEIKNTALCNGYNLSCKVKCCVMDDNYYIDKIILIGYLTDADKEELENLLSTFKTKQTVIVFEGE